MEILSGFKPLREQALPELNSTAQVYRHVKTGTELLSIVNDDENKVFGVTFRTPPRNSTEVAHILEHAVLCGSRKYPVKEPFVELMKGSLNTFLNAASTNASRSDLLIAARAASSRWCSAAASRSASSAATSTWSDGGYPGDCGRSGSRNKARLQQCGF